MFVLDEHAVVVNVGQSGMDSNEDQQWFAVLSHWLTLNIIEMIEVLLKLKCYPVLIVVVSRLASQLCHAVVALKPRPHAVLLLAKPLNLLRLFEVLAQPSDVVPGPLGAQLKASIQLASTLDLNPKWHFA